MKRIGNIYYGLYDINNIYKAYIPRVLREVTIYEPKKRIIVVQDIYDKVINHLISREILIPYLSNCLIDSDVASKKGYGTSKGRKLYFKYRNICDLKYDKYYILKIDISKFFSNIVHDILKDKIRKKLSIKMY